MIHLCPWRIHACDWLLLEQMSKRLPCSSRTDTGRPSIRIFHLYTPFQWFPQTPTGQNTVPAHVFFDDRRFFRCSYPARQLEPAGCMRPLLHLKPFFGVPGYREECSERKAMALKCGLKCTSQAPWKHHLSSASAATATPVLCASGRGFCMGAGALQEWVHFHFERCRAGYSLICMSHNGLCQIPV